MDDVWDSKWVSLGACLHHLYTLLSWMPSAELFPTWEPHAWGAIFTSSYHKPVLYDVQMCMLYYVCHGEHFICYFNHYPKFIQYDKCIIIFAMSYLFWKHTYLEPRLKIVPHYIFLIPHLAIIEMIWLMMTDGSKTISFVVLLKLN